MGYTTITTQLSKCNNDHRTRTYDMDFELRLLVLTLLCLPAPDLTSVWFSKHEQPLRWPDLEYQIDPRRARPVGLSIL